MSVSDIVDYGIYILRSCGEKESQYEYRITCCDGIYNIFEKTMHDNIPIGYYYENYFFSESKKILVREKAELLAKQMFDELSIKYNVNHPDNDGKEENTFNKFVTLKYGVQMIYRDHRFPEMDSIKRDNIIHQHRVMLRTINTD